MIARSSEQYAGAQNARALCRRSGEREPRKHKTSLMVS
jgi:hypothetical protein